jgi:serine/threonine protein kinase
VRMLRSPHIVRTYDFGVTGDGFAYIALEYLRGLDLDALVHAHGPIEPRRALRLMRQACRGLGDAHDAGVIHHDVKPANLHISDQRGAEDLLRILDFGVAGSMHERATGGVVVGTPAYMAPESFTGDGNTPAADVYALGATFYFALTGVPPIDGDTPYELQRAHERAPVVPPSLRSGVDVPRAFERIILRCLAKAPEDRYPNAAAVGDALDQVLPLVRTWTREDAARWWRHARTGALNVPTGGGAEHTTDVGIIKLNAR